MEEQNMCTAATYKTKDFYFGRTLDYEISYGDQVVITPRNYVFDLREGGQLKNHYAMIGMACVMENYPLYYDAVNEKGLGIAGLNFVGNASYKKPVEGKDNITQFELIPWILGKCATVKEARQLLKNMNLIDTPFLPDLPVAQLHWIIADKEECITLESLKSTSARFSGRRTGTQRLIVINSQIKYFHLADTRPLNRVATFLHSLEFYFMGYFRIPV